MDAGGILYEEKDGERRFSGGARTAGSRGDQGQGARAARRAAAVGDDCYEHNIALFFDFIKQLGKNPSHGYSS